MLDGAIDMHVHTFPDLFDRRLSDIELVRSAKSAGMAGVLLKNHFESTVSRALLCRGIVEGINVYGGLVLNESVGGLNPRAVEVALKLGAKEIWMPTIDALNHIRKTSGVAKKGIRIFREDGSLKDEIYEILDLIAESNAILGTGHLSLEEILRLVEEALKRGVQKVLITHPEFWITRVPLSIQLELSRKGVFFERCFYVVMAEGKARVSVDEIANFIKIVGPQTTVISSDLGQSYNPDPVEGLKSYVEGLLKAGIMEKEVELMLKSNPKELLGVDGSL